MAEIFNETSTSRYGRAFVRWKPNGKLDGVRTVSDFVKKNCHVGRDSQLTFLVARMAPKPILSTYLTNPCLAIRIKTKRKYSHHRTVPRGSWGRNSVHRYRSRIGQCFT